MAVKTTIDSRGVVTETTTGTKDVLVFDVDTERDTVVNVVSASGTTSVEGGSTLLIARTAIVTASLPSLSADDEGMKVLLMLDGQGNGVVDVTGSAGALSIDGNAIQSVSGAYGHLELVGVKADDDGGFLWHIVDQKPAV